MGLHDFEFTGRQLARFVQNLIGNGKLADVVQSRRHNNRGALDSRNVIAIGFTHKPIEQDFCQVAHMQHVRAAFAVAQLHSAAHDIHEHIVALRALVVLLGQKGRKTPLAGIQSHNVAHTLANHTNIEGTPYVVGSSQLIGAQHRLVGIFAGNHDDGNAFDPAASNHTGKHFEAVHIGHDDIKQHEGNLFSVLFEGRNSFLAILSLDNFVFLFQHLGENLAIHGRVVNDEQQRAIRLLFLEGLGIHVGYHRIMALLGFIHETVGRLNGIFNQHALCHHAANADRKRDLVVSGNSDFVNRV